MPQCKMYNIMYRPRLLPNSKYGNFKNNLNLTGNMNRTNRLTAVAFMETM